MMDYHELINELSYEDNPYVLDYIGDAVEMLEHLHSELAAANVRCATLDKLLTEYQDKLIPGYRERAERAERERDAAVKFCGKLFALCSPPQKWWSKLFRRLPARVGDYMGSGYSFIDSANRIIDEFTETAEESLYNSQGTGGMSMNLDKLVKALTCNSSADEADNLGCRNKRCKYRDVDGACDIVGMCEDAAIAIKQLAAIMDTLGDDYDLDRLRELVAADREGRYVILPFRPPKTVYSCSKRFPEPGQAHYATAINILWDMDRGCVFGDTPEAAKAALKARESNG